jgi:hypothetical protein
MARTRGREYRFEVKYDTEEERGRIKSARKRLGLKNNSEVIKYLMEKYDASNSSK